MRGKITELWHRHVDRKPWVFRDRFGLAYLFTREDEVADYCARNAVINNPPLLAYLPQAVKPGQCFVDLSPEIGGVTLLVAQLMKSEGTVFAMTPDVKCYRQLVNNVALNQLTGRVCTIGRAVLELPDTAVAITLDRFAAEWKWGTVDHLRLADVSLLDALSQSAKELFQAGRIKSLILDDVEKSALTTANTTLTKLGFKLQIVTAEGKLQPLNTTAAPDKLTLIAVHQEAGHA
jgi:hypothetical protein